jgi:starch-binding outer membrane protein, SusD/RagB family
MKTDLWNDFYGYGHPIAMSHAISDLAVSMASADLRAHLTPNDQAAPWPTLDFFDDAYEYIRNANVLISRIDDIELEPEVRDRFVAKAYFFRSYWYYRIVSTYGDVPWVGQEAEGAVLDYQTYSRTAILNKLEQDLSWAEERLESGRMTDGTITSAPLLTFWPKCILQI